MQRRTFFQALSGFVAGGIGALLSRDHFREVVKKVKTPVATCGTTGNFVGWSGPIEPLGKLNGLEIPLQVDIADDEWISGDWGVACPFCNSSDARLRDNEPLLFGCNKCGAVFDVRMTNSWPAILYRVC